ncbi:hypothetical protein [Oerskovia paurometabola]|uniref:hypothetical protein n=1 Tax=Oerskovia paurometabola TaxID=162170 RepID=UPI0034149CA1
MVTPTLTRTQVFAVALLGGMALLALAYATSATWAWALAVRDALPAPLHGLVAAGPGLGTWLFRLVAGLVGIVLVGVVVHLVRRRSALTLVTSLVLLTVAVSWPRAQVGTAERFAAYRVALSEVAAPDGEGARDPGEDGLLPNALRYVSANGRVDRYEDGRVFVPQWLGMPDDAGGFWFSPGESPAGLDMHGMICADPVPLEGEWWACGME